jgi:hypothetical protein
MQLFGQRRVIPIWATDAIPSAFDMTEVSAERDSSLIVT